MSENSAQAYDGLVNFIIVQKIGDEEAPQDIPSLLKYFEDNEAALFESRTYGTSMLRELDPETVQAFLNGLDLCLRYAIEIEYNKIALYQSFYLRMLNAGTQAQITNSYDTFSKKISKFQSDQSDLTRNIQKLEKNGKKVKAAIRDANTQSITILGIFSAVVFTFSGGFSLIGSAFSGIKDISYRNSHFLIALIMLLSIALIDVVFLLLSYLDRINNHVDDITCEPQKLKDQFVDTVKKHPLIVLINLTLFLGIFFSMLTFNSSMQIVNVNAATIVPSKVFYVDVTPNPSVASHSPKSTSTPKNEIVQRTSKP